MGQRFSARCNDSNPSGSGGGVLRLTTIASLNRPLKKTGTHTHNGDPRSRMISTQVHSTYDRVEKRVGIVVLGGGSVRFLHRQCLV